MWNGKLSFEWEAVVTQNTLAMPLSLALWIRDLMQHNWISLYYFQTLLKAMCFMESGWQSARKTHGKGSSNWYWWGKEVTILSFTTGSMMSTGCEPVSLNTHNTTLCPTMVTCLCKNKATMQACWRFSLSLKLQASTRNLQQSPPLWNSFTDFELYWVNTLGDSSYSRGLSSI